MVTVSLDSPSCEVTLFDPVSVVYRDATQQTKVLYRLKYVGALSSGLACLSRYNSGWFCHTGDSEILSGYSRSQCPDIPDIKLDSPDKQRFFTRRLFLVVGLILMAFVGSLEHNYHINTCGSKSLLIVRRSYTQFQNKI
jgi:hypothetical protein